MPQFPKMSFHIHEERSFVIYTPLIRIVDIQNPHLWVNGLNNLSPRDGSTDFEPMLRNNL